MSPLNKPYFHHKHLERFTCYFLQRDMLQIVCSLLCCVSGHKGKPGSWRIGMDFEEEWVMVKRKAVDGFWNVESVSPKLLNKPIENNNLPHTNRISSQNIFPRCQTPPTTNFSRNRLGLHNATFFNFCHNLENIFLFYLTISVLPMKMKIPHRIACFCYGLGLLRDSPWLWINVNK